MAWPGSPTGSSRRTARPRSASRSSACWATSTCARSCFRAAWTRKPLASRRARARRLKARQTAVLFPLDRAGGLRGHVVDDAVDAFDLVHDAVGDAAQELHVEVVEVGGHAVARGDRAQRADVLVGALIAHDAHGLDRKQHGEGLPDRVVEAGAPDLLDEEGVRAP